MLGLIHIVLSLVSSAPSALLIAADIFAFLAVIYGGFAMNFVNGIPLWNTALLPVLYVISGLWGGAEVTLGINLAGGAAGAAVESWIRILLIGFILLVPIYLVSVRYASQAGGASVINMVLNKWSPLFWAAVVLLGMVIPLAAVITSFMVGLEGTPAGLIYLAILSGLAGDLAMRYLILRCGLYSPLIPSNSYD